MIKFAHMNYTASTNSDLLFDLSRCKFCGALKGPDSIREAFAASDCAMAYNIKDRTPTLAAELRYDAALAVDLAEHQPKAVTAWRTRQLRITGSPITIGNLVSHDFPTAAMHHSSKKWRSRILKSERKFKILSCIVIRSTPPMLLAPEESD